MKKRKRDIREFPLAWRWTDPGRAGFPAAVLKQLIPLDEEEAAGMESRLAGVMSGPRLDRKQVVSLRRHDAGEPSGPFLASLDVDAGTQVVLCWGNGRAIRTTWGIFEKYWSDFCYPESDDVLIGPEDHSWILFYCHERLFEFGRRRRVWGS